MPLMEHSAQPIDLVKKGTLAPRNKGGTKEGIAHCGLCSNQKNGMINIRSDRSETDTAPGATFFVPLGRDKFIKEILRYVGRIVRCSVAGLLLVDGQSGQVILFRARPVDDLFLQAMQKRLMSSYQVSVGPAMAAPQIEMAVYGDAISGPYEPPRSVLTAPILSDGRVVGMVAIASVFSEAFCNQDLCVLSTVAAQVSVMLNQHRLDKGSGRKADAAHAASACLERESVLSRERLQSRVSHYVTSICGLARLWQAQGENELPEILRQDLDAIVENALQIHDLVIQ